MEHLRIQNYRGIEDLTIEGIEPINLIVGKNNTGKTSVLEAVRLWKSQFGTSVFREILEERGELYAIEVNNLESTLNVVLSLFNRRELDTNKPIICIENSKEKIRFELGIVEENQKESGDGTLVRRQKFNSFKRNTELSKKERLGIQISNGGVIFYTLDFIFDGSFRFLQSRSNSYAIEYVNSKSYQPEKNEHLWDKIALTEFEKYIVESLQIIDETVTGLNFVEDRYKGRGRTPIIKSAGFSKPLPLSTMGDGMNRLLTIILHMINCQNGVFLVDEVENGLHYEVQVKMWRMIAKLAQDLNIQVFATTHSNDAIKTFCEVMMEKATPNGAIHRLYTDSGKIYCTSYDSDLLDNILEVDEEVR